MNAQAFRPQVIEALKTLWVALPVRAPGEYGDDATERQMAILDAYCFALSDISSEAVWQTVNNLRAGKIDDASKDFCPKAPKLAEYARSEQRRLDAVNRPRLPAPQPAGHQFIDWRIIHRQKAEALANKGFVCTPGILIEAARAGELRRKWRVGSVWFWSIDEVWSPS